VTDDVFATRATELRAGTPRDLARRVALDGLGAAYRLSGAERRWLRRPRVQHLFLHHVFEDEEESFRRLLAELADGHEFVSYSEAVERTWQGPIDRPYLAVSFDDGLKSCGRAADILAEHGISACFFVVGEMVGQHDPAAVARFCRERLAMPPTELLDWDDLEALLAAGHEVGSHTMSHARLSELDEAGLSRELEGSHDLLTRRLGGVKHFAWAYGHFEDAFPGVVGRALSAGFTSCAANERGAHVTTGPRESLCVRRDHVVATWPPAHVRYFMARNSRLASAATNTFPER
jgi:peptidoglycan/xylan/chitin deacetylase (PgdA/CDA1 family)